MSLVGLRSKFDFANSRAQIYRFLFLDHTRKRTEKYLGSKGMVIAFNLIVKSLFAVKPPLQNTGCLEL